MELATWIVAPFLVGVAMGLLLRHHRRLVAVIALAALAAYAVFAHYALGSDHEYGALAAVMYGLIGTSWLAGLAAGTALTSLRRRRLPR